MTFQINPLSCDPARIKGMSGPFFKAIFKEIEMKTITIVSLALIGYLVMLGSLSAADSCSKECSAFQKVCLQAHSKAACQMDYNICIKHCQAK